MSPWWVLEEEMPEFTERAMSYVLESGSDPFFLYFPLTAPHTPVVLTDELKGNRKVREIDPDSERVD